MRTELQLRLETNASSAEEPIFRGLRAFNVGHLGEYAHSPVVISLCDGSGGIHGGIVGGIHLNWLNIDILWVKESLRGHGYGSRLLQSIHEFAIQNGATRAFLDTMEFQAVGFYLRHGYFEFGRIKNFANGFDRVYLQKDLAQ